MDEVLTTTDAVTDFISDLRAKTTTPNEVLVWLDQSMKGLLDVLKWSDEDASADTGPTRDAAGQLALAAVAQAGALAKQYLEQRANLN